MVDRETREREALDVGVQAVIYGLPLVMMDLTKKRATNVTLPAGAAAPINQVGAMRAFPTRPARRSFIDADGRSLTGANQYTLHFEAGSLPPVHAFWSVTLYDPQSFFVDNPARWYAISSWMPLQQNMDGSVDLYIQHAAPGAGDEERRMCVCTRQESRRKCKFTLILLVGATGFEPATLCSQSRCATRLRYAPTGEISLILLPFSNAPHSFNWLLLQNCRKTPSRAKTRLMVATRHGGRT